LAAGRSGVERLRGVAQTSGEQCDAEHQQQVADDRYL
jgi:hypothetical protein